MRSVARVACVLLWLSAATAAAQHEKVLFEDPLKGKLKEGWHWLRLSPQAWKMTEQGLMLKVEPGKANDAKNVLMRRAPERGSGVFAYEVTVTFTTPPTNQFEQAGITWYLGGKPGTKLVHERIDGATYIVPGKLPAPEPTVQLRLIVAGNKYTAQFRPNGQGEFKTVGSGNLPPAETDEVSIQCYNGPADAEHWIRFENFRVLKLTD
jgi:hypothetical protein